MQRLWFVLSELSVNGVAQESTTHKRVRHPQARLLKTTSPLLESPCRLVEWQRRGRFLGNGSDFSALCTWCRDPGRLTVSLAESICLRAVIKPVTFPLKLWLSYKAVLATKGGLGVHRGKAMASMSIFRLPAPCQAIAHRQ